MSIKPALNQFNGGEISPQLEGRFDWDKYNYSAKLCKNFVPLVEGSLKRRGGSHFVTETEDLPMYYLTFNVTATGASKVYVVINGEENECTLSSGVFTYVTALEYGSVVDYVIQSDGFVEKSATITISTDTTITETLVNIADAVTLTIVPKPRYATCIIDGVERKSVTVEQGTSVKYSVSYNGTTKSATVTVNSTQSITVIVDYIVVQATSATSGSFTCDDGLYEIKAVGGGGGAGGGAVHGSKPAGGGGGSGAGYNGNAHLNGTYTYVVGSGGAGGKYSKKGTNGSDGSDTTISGLLLLGAGKAGKAPKNILFNSADGGAGGTGTKYSANILGSITQGVAGSGSVGGKINIVSSYGNGGDGKGGSTGNTGKSGYLRIRYLGDYNG